MKKDMEDLLRFVKKLLKTIVSGVGAFFLLLYLPLCVVMCAVAACLYLCAVAVGFLLACLTDDGGLSKYVFPRFAGKSKWIPQLKFD